MTLAEFAKKVGIGAYRARQLCGAGVVPGAAKQGRRWYLPEDAAIRFIVARAQRDRQRRAEKQAFSLEAAMPSELKRKRQREWRQLQVRKAWADPTKRARLRAGQLASWTPERRAKQAEVMRARWQDPEFRARVVERMGEAGQSFESRKRRRDAALRSWRARKANEIGGEQA